MYVYYCRYTSVTVPYVHITIAIYIYLLYLYICAPVRVLYIHTISCIHITYYMILLIKNISMRRYNKKYLFIYTN